MFNQNRESKRMEMGWSKPELGCKRHQNHKQLQGVCPFCLRERLSQLAAVAAAPLKKSSTVSSQSCNSSSSASSSGGNTSLGRRRHNRNVSEISFMLSSGSSNGLKKSRSMAFVPRKFVGEIKNGKKKNGFWSKLLHRERKKEIFMA